MEFTKCELEVMHVIWKEKRPLSGNDIIALSEVRSWKDRSIHALLNGLLSKQAIKEDGMVRCGKIYARCFSPRISYEEYYAEQVLATGGQERLPKLFSALIRVGDLSAETLDELEAILEARRAELKKKKK